MTTWFIAAITATFLWAVVNLIDDNLLRNVYRSSRFAAIIAGLFGFVPSFYFFVTNQTLVTAPKVVLPAIAAGVLTVVFYFFYFKALEADEPSIAIALNNLAPAFIPILAFVFLGERLRHIQYLGVAIIVAMSVTLALVDVRKLRFSKALVFAIYGSITYAVISILAKYAYNQAEFRDVFVWLSFGLGVGGLSFLYLGNPTKKEFKKVMRKSSGIIVFFLLLVELLNIGAEMTHGFAISSGPVSLVQAIGGAQPIFILLIGILFQPFYPKNFREKRDIRFSKKLFCMLVMLVGLVLVQT